MRTEPIVPDIYWVGAVDWTMRTFHGRTFSTRRGTTYNAYLINDSEPALVDAVHQSFTRELLENIRRIIPIERLRYIVVNHVEADHSGALPELMRFCPQATIVCSARCQAGLKKHYGGDWRYKIVSTGEKLPLGRKTLSFIEAPMIHWPDSMFTYCVEDALLMPNDAFGQHYATAERFSDQVDQSALMEEAVRYYANILWPLGVLIGKKIDELLGLNIPVRIIAPSHGVIWRKDPLRIVREYKRWAANETARSAVIVYETMWGATAEMARLVARGIRDAGAVVSVFDIAYADPSDVATAMLTARGFVFGSSTHDNGMLPTLAGFLHYLQGKKPKNRVGGAFGSYGWGGGALKEIEGVLDRTGINRPMPSLGVSYTPDEQERAACYEFGSNFAGKL